MPNQAIIVSNTLASKIEALRKTSYHHSTGFKITNDEEFDKYCQWNKKDDTGVVLAILNEHGDPVSTLRANVYFNNQEHEKNNPGFAGHTENFITYPVLDMTFAATDPSYFKSGFLSVLRYYMYVLHRHTVKSITGQVVKESTLFFSLQKLGYNFKEIDKTRPEFENSTKTTNKWMLTNLENEKFDTAIERLKTKYKDTIKMIPLLIN